MFNMFKKKVSNPSEACMKARALIGEGQVDKAFSIYENVMEEHPGFSMAYADRGTLYAMTKQHKEAVVDLLKALALGYRESSVFTTLATIYMQQGDFQNSLKNFNEAEAIDPNNPFIYYNRSGAHAALGDKERAIADLNRCIGFGLDANFLNAVNQRVSEINAKS